MEPRFDLALHEYESRKLTTRQSHTTNVLIQAFEGIAMI